MEQEEKGAVRMSVVIIPAYKPDKALISIRISYGHMDAGLL